MRKNKNKSLLRYFIVSISVDVLIAGVIVLANYLIVYKIPQKHQISDVNVTTSSEANFIETENTNELWKERFKDKFSDTPIITDTEYKTSDISVSIKQESYGEDKDKVTYYVADVYISDIKMFQTHFAQNTYGVGYKEDLVSMSNTMKSVLAINGDSYSNDGRQNSSTIIRNGKVYRTGTATSDVCVLYYDGTIKIYSPQEFDANQVIQDGAYQTWSFGPSLLDENGKVLTSYNTWDYIKKAHPRSAMGYYEPGHYAFVLVDGRNEGYSRGMTLEELSKVFEDLGCKSAYNLDGGHCSFMTLGTEIVNQPYEFTDDISDGIFIGEYE